MKVYFGQIYIEPRASFPFSHIFQRFLSESVTQAVKPSAKFEENYGIGFKLIFNISAKSGLGDNEVRGPAVFKKTKDVEYTVFLPYDVITQEKDVSTRALQFLFKGVYSVFDELEIDATKVKDLEAGLIEFICSDPTMFEDESWIDQLRNDTRRSHTR